MQAVIYGGQYGSEGKGSASEYFARKCRRLNKHGNLTVIGENAPNSGHSNSVGKTRNMPVSAFFADRVYLGPDAVVSPEALADDLEAVRKINPDVEIYIHENAALMAPDDGGHESGVISRVSSTGSGSGWARYQRNYQRLPERTVAYDRTWFINAGVILLSTDAWLSHFLNVDQHTDLIFECSQGVMLDVGLGLFPFVTTRSTIPQAAIARNGLARLTWDYVGVYRTFPIRTGGPSGPTGGKEIEFGDIGVPDEIATVTKRTRRVFEFSVKDFELSLIMSNPTAIMFTHLDYIGVDVPVDGTWQIDKFNSWMDEQMILHAIDNYCPQIQEVMGSSSNGIFRIATGA